MPHDTSLIATIAVGLAFAFVGGFAAARLRLPPLVGYLLAGIAVGPFTPGLVADTKLAPQLAEIGVILLMFGVGMHSPSAICGPCARSLSRARSPRSRSRRPWGPGAPPFGDGRSEPGWCLDWPSLWPARSS